MMHDASCMYTKLRALHHLESTVLSNLRYHTDISAAHVCRQLYCRLDVGANALQYVQELLQVAVAAF